MEISSPSSTHCVDLIFLRRVGGGYIFVHRLLMEHFAEMYKESCHCEVSRVNLRQVRQGSSCILRPTDSNQKTWDCFVRRFDFLLQ